MEKQPDQQVPQGTEKTPGSRRSAETLNRIVAALAERPQGVSAQELTDAATMAHDKAYSCLHRRMRSGMLVFRRGVEGGSVITRFWLSDEAADAFKFPATLRKSHWDEVV